MTPANPPATLNIDTLYQDIGQLIEAAKTHVASQVNQALVITYPFCRHCRQNIEDSLNGIIVTLSQQLSWSHFGEAGMSISVKPQ